MSYAKRTFLLITLSCFLIGGFATLIHAEPESCADIVAEYQECVAAGDACRELDLEAIRDDWAASGCWIPLLIYR